MFSQNQNCFFVSTRQQLKIITPAKKQKKLPVGKQTSLMIPVKDIKKKKLAKSNFQVLFQMRDDMANLTQEKRDLGSKGLNTQQILNLGFLHVCFNFHQPLGFLNLPFKCMQLLSRQKHIPRSSIASLLSESLKFRVSLSLIPPRTAT